MEGEHAKRFDDELAEMRQRVMQWRETRPKLEPMPAELWEAAVTLAREHGPYRVSRAMRIDYGSLKQRLEESRTRVQPRDVGDGSDGYAVIPWLADASAGQPRSSEAELEVRGPDGSRLTIRLVGSSSLDVAGVVAAFRGRAG